MDLTLQAIRDRLGAELAGDGAVRITGINALESATAGDLVFAEHERMAPQVQQTQAAGILVPKTFPAIPGKNLLRVANPREAFVAVMMLFAPKPASGQGIHPSAVVSPEAVIGPEVTIRECVVVRRGARIGKGTVIESGVHVGEGVTIGEGCQIGPNVVLMFGVRLGNRVIIHGSTVVGGDGFGFVWAKDHYLKIPQLGTVIIEDDVELGCNMCVDRATFGATIVRRGTKTDNLVQIAHNDVVGQHVILTGQVGLSGSVTIGDRAMLGGQSGVVDHVTIGEGAKVGAGTPVTKDVKPGEMVWGFPGRPIERAKRELAALSFLPKLLKQVRDLTARLDRLDKSETR
jgi:UDP-3-O-[3-hydroxymyristoyl] glucosamine N-acyltransferase